MYKLFAIILIWLGIPNSSEMFPENIICFANINLYTFLKNRIYLLLHVFLKANTLFPNHQKKKKANYHTLSVFIKEMKKVECISSL